MMGSSIRLGKIFGIPIEVNYSWIFVFLLITFRLAQTFGHDHPGWPPVTLWSVAAFTALLFFLSVLAHELTHSVVAIRKGIPVRGITLFIFGGVSQLAHEARQPFTEFLVAVVGPLSSILLGAVFLGLWWLVGDASTGLSDVLLLLCIINVSLGVFNMLPGFPLDGGRVMRAVVWGLTGSYWRATQVATRSGQLIGGMMVVGGVALAFFSAAGIQSIWLALIGGFLLFAATASYRQEKRREGMRSHTVSEAMGPVWQTLPPETPVDSQLVAQVFGQGQGVLVVSREGRIDGVLTRRALSRLPGRNRPYTLVSEAMVPLASMAWVKPGDSVADTLERMETEGLEQMAVRRDDVILGFISRDDILRFAVRLQKSRR